MHQMLLRNISSLVDVAPLDVLHKQLQEVEKSMSVVGSPLCATENAAVDYFPKTAAGYIYVLRLEGDELHDHYYYVGFTQDVAKRMHDHFHGEGSEWTKLHPPRSIMEISEGDKSDERQKTIAIMKTYGWSKTRGYCWCSKVLKAPPRELEH